MREKDGSICWKCAHAGNGRVCEWMRDFTPVAGWDATYKKTLDSYYVKCCPKFEDDMGIVRKPKDIPTESFIRLMESLLERAVTDWKMSCRVAKGEIEFFDRNLSHYEELYMKTDVEKFLTGDLFPKLTGLDGKKILAALRK